MTEQTQTPRLPTPVAGRVRDLLRTEATKRRFEEVLNKRAPQFLASLAQLVYQTPGMDDCDPNSVFASAMIAATLDLPIDKNLGQAWIIPYNNKKTGKKEAQFQLGYKGYIQLALRTAQYKSINVSRVYEGELEFNRFTGAITFHERKSEEVVGYLGYILLLNGYEKYLYMSVAELKKHAEKFSKGYQYETSLWKTNFDGMACKTVIKAILTKWGILSVEMRQAVLAEAPEDDEPEVEHPRATPEQVAAAKSALFGEEETGDKKVEVVKPAFVEPTSQDWTDYYTAVKEADKLKIEYTHIDVDSNQADVQAATKALRDAIAKF